MSTIKVTFVQLDGVERTIENAATGQSLMTLAKSNNIDGILADCGGGCACATCHVYVDDKWLGVVGPADSIELSTLDMVSDLQRSSSRLSCQVMLRPDMDGLRVSVAPS